MPSDIHILSLTTVLEVLRRHYAESGDGWLSKNTLPKRCYACGNEFMFDPGGLTFNAFLQILQSAGFIRIAGDERRTEIQIVRDFPTTVLDEVALH